MNSQLPKQFIEINKLPIILHSANAFISYDSAINLIFVINSDYIDYFEQLTTQYGFVHPYTIIRGGVERFYSVKNGLEQMGANGLVAVHDSVRPMVSQTTIAEGFRLAMTKGNAIPAIKPSDSIRIDEQGDSQPIDRNKIRLIQTPQCFKTEIIVEAYNQNYSDSFTDDASVVEAMGEKIHLYEGNPENIKITTPYDLQIAQMFL